MKSTMASFTMSTARLAAPAKVSGLGFRKAISAVRLAAKPAPVATKAVAMTVCKTKAKPGHGKAKTNKSAAKRFKITASGKVRLRPPPRLASRADKPSPNRVQGLFVRSRRERTFAQTAYNATGTPIAARFANRREEARARPKEASLAGVFPIPAVPRKAFPPRPSR